MKISQFPDGFRLNSCHGFSSFSFLGGKIKGILDSRRDLKLRKKRLKKRRKRWLTQDKSGRGVTLLLGTSFLHINGVF